MAGDEQIPCLLTNRWHLPLARLAAQLKHVICFPLPDNGLELVVRNIPACNFPDIISSPVKDGRVTAKNISQNKCRDRHKYEYHNPGTHFIAQCSNQCHKVIFKEPQI